MLPWVVFKGGNGIVTSQNDGILKEERCLRSRFFFKITRPIRFSWNVARGS